MTGDDGRVDAGEERAGGEERDAGGQRDDGEKRDEGEGYECPFCGSTDTERESAFGSEVSAEQHYCHGCHTVFERIKFDGASADTGRSSDADRSSDAGESSDAGQRPD